MLFVNLIHENENLLEYVFISLFFKFFGIATFNTVLPYADPNELDLPDYFVPINIFIADKDNEERMELLYKYDVVVSGDELEVVKDFVPFPKSLKKDKDIREFFTKIIDKIQESFMLDIDNWWYESEFERVYLNKDSMINMFISANPLVNWFVPLRVIKDRYFSKMTISLLLKKYRETKGRDSGYEKYAHINIGYMANHLCNRDMYSSNIDWKELIKESENLNPAEMDEESIYFMLARLYEESEKNIALSNAFYNKSDYKYNYYASYRHARLHEFKYNNIEMCKKHLLESVKYNENYYRAVYKLGLMADLKDSYDEALDYYIDVYRILDPRIRSDCWSPLDMEYYLKVCGKIMGLNRYFHADGAMKKFYDSAAHLINSIENNVFLKNFAKFIADDINTEAVWYKSMIRDVKKNAEEHYDKFCGIYSFD